jgi:proteasome lid subunit RPN8/RPN11
LAERARAAYPLECCGFLIGRRHEKCHQVVRVEPVRNAHPSAPESSYLIAPEDCLVAELAARRSDLEILGFYHSHPEGDSRPSSRDLQEALPACSYVILSVRGGEPGDPEAWCLSPDRSRFRSQALTGEAVEDFA